jgi:hypothetical protein
MFADQPGCAARRFLSRAAQAARLRFDRQVIAGSYNYTHNFLMMRTSWSSAI